MTTKPHDNLTNLTEHSIGTAHLIRRPKVERITGLKRGAIYKCIRTGLLTPPIKIGSRVSAWPEHEIAYVNVALIRGASDDQIKALVSNLVSQRTAGEGQ